MKKKTNAHDVAPAVSFFIFHLKFFIQSPVAARRVAP
jgi:hypothetical protein